MSKTASDLKRAGWAEDEVKKYHPWEALERYSKDAGLKIRQERAQELVRALAAMLKEKYGASRLVLFGSLAHQSWFTPRSDIDLCVEGIPVDAFFKAEADVESMAGDFKVGLVDSRECTPELLRQIDEEGVEL
jgi:predicted nucleotidyltransferase